MTDDPMNLNLITGILDVLNRYGYTRSDDEHAGRAIDLTSDLAHIYEGPQHHPFGPSSNETPPQAEPAPPEPASNDVIPIPAGQVTTLLTALDITADYQRDRAELRPDCTTQSCPACESRLRDARAYDRLSAQLDQAAEASAAATASRPEPAPAADREAGQ
jgi:hypothetical protein